MHYSADKADKHSSVEGANKPQGTDKIFDKKKMLLDIIILSLLYIKYVIIQLFICLSPQFIASTVYTSIYQSNGQWLWTSENKTLYMSSTV